MVRTKIIEARICGLTNDLFKAGIGPSKVMLFGSYASGNATDESDIDVAIWASGFTGARSLDIEKVAHIVSRYPLIELHTFSDADTDDQTPFAEEILKTGKDYSVYLKGRD